MYKGRAGGLQSQRENERERDRERPSKAEILSLLGRDLGLILSR